MIRNTTFLSLLFLSTFMIQSGLAQTYLSYYGQNSNYNISVLPGTYDFMIANVPQLKETEWYVNGVYKETDSSGTIGYEPEFSWSFMSGTTEIKSLIYHSNPRVLEETHIWNVTSFQTAPGSPTALQGGSITDTSFTASWFGLVLATKYYLDVSTDSTFSSFLTGYNNKDVGSATNSNLSGLTPGTSYFYRVRAANLYGTSPSSNIIKVITLVVTVIPLPPVALIPGLVNQNNFLARWSPSTGATGYFLDVAKDSNFFIYVPTMWNSFVGSSTSYIVDNLNPGTNYYYRVRAQNSLGISSNSNIISVQTTLVSVKDKNNELPLEFSLSQNYPNPFNPSTLIRYQLPVDSKVNLKVFDILGIEVTTLVDENQPAGSYNYQLSVSQLKNYQLSSGVYYYRISTISTDRNKNFIATKKAVYLK